VDDSSTTETPGPETAVLGPGGARRALSSQPALLAAAWLATRASMAVQLGWFGGSKFYEDVRAYQYWASLMLATHHLPTVSSWQYPVGAAWLFLIPHLDNNHYGAIFCLLMYACDLGLTLVLWSVARRGGQVFGVWWWIALVPGLGPLTLMRFDLLPTFLFVAALALLWSERRVGWFGVLLGLGAIVKVWPVLGLIAAASRRELLKAAAWLLATAGLVIGLSAAYFGDTLGFIANQGGRGLEFEAVAAIPVWIQVAVTGRVMALGYGSGSIELRGDLATSVASGLLITWVLLAIALLAWWVLQARAGRLTPALGVDAVLAALLCYIVVSPVLSPQYLIWLAGASALALCAGQTAMSRPILLIAAAVLMTHFFYGLLEPHGLSPHAITPRGPAIIALSRSTAIVLLARNVLLLLAAVDAVRVIVGLTHHRAREAQIALAGRAF
jgi:hypothetical protein